MLGKKTVRAQKRLTPLPLSQVKLPSWMPILRSFHGLLNTHRMTTLPGIFNATHQSCVHRVGKLILVQCQVSAQGETWEDIPKWGLSMTGWRIRQCVVSGSQAMGMKGFEDLWDTYFLWLSCPQLVYCFAMFCCSSRVLICSMHVQSCSFWGCGSEWLDLQKESSYVCCVTVCVHVKKQKVASQVSRSDNATPHIVLYMTNIHQTW